jgi:hypothetical protein
MRAGTRLGSDRPERAKRTARGWARITRIGQELCVKAGTHKLGDRMTIFGFGGLIILCFFAVREAGDGVVVGVNADS